jgi:hypothetical protein
MLKIITAPPASVIGPQGQQLTYGDLPPRDTTRWVARRKAEVVAAVNGGLLSFPEACDRYDLSPEELSTWQYAVAREGLAGLKVTRQRRRYYGPLRSAA